MATIKIVILFHLEAQFIEQYLRDATGNSDIRVVSGFQKSESEIAQLVTDAVVIIGDWWQETRITPTIVKSARACRLIIQPSIGYDVVDIAACSEAGIRVANAAGASDISVAEHTLAMSLCLAKKMVEQDQTIREGKWLYNRQNRNAKALELFGKTWGIIGMGRIGRELAVLLTGFNMRILYYDIQKLTANEEAEYNVAWTPFDELLQQSDIVSLHLPLNSNTRHIIGREQFDQMKSNAFLINAGRGGLVDESALSQAIAGDKIAGAGLDVFESEPLPPDHQLIHTKNTVLSMHSAGVTEDSAPRYFSITMENTIQVLNGEEPFNIINHSEVLTSFTDRSSCSSERR